MNLKINNIKIDLILILIGICPIFFLSDNLNALDILRNQRIMFFFVSCLLIIAACHANKFIGAFLMLSVAHHFMFPSLEYFNTKMTFLLCGSLVYHFVKKDYKGENYKYVLLAVTTATVVIATLQYFGKDIFFYAEMETPGLMILPGYMGQFCAIVAPVIATVHPAFLIIPIIGLALSKSIVSIGAFCVAMLFMAWFKSRRLFVCLVILAILTMPFIAKRDYDSGEWFRRIQVWKMVSSRAARSPFIGKGIGNYKKTLFMEWHYRDVSRWFSVELKPENIAPLYQKIREIAEEGGFDTTRLDVHDTLLHRMDELRGKGLGSYVWDHPHCEYLLVYYEYGLLGFLILLCFIADIFRRFVYQDVPTWRFGDNKDKQEIALMASFISILILCTVHFTLHLPITVPAAIVLTAMLDRRLQ